jgi:hypothetical protein
VCQTCFPIRDFGFAFDGKAVELEGVTTTADQAGIKNKIKGPLAKFEGVVL